MPRRGYVLDSDPYLASDFTDVEVPGLPVYRRRGMERTPHDSDATIADAQRAVVDSVLTELELGITFLDVAATTADHRHAQENVRHAIKALRTADRFLLAVYPHGTRPDAIQLRREQLARRLRAITRGHDSNRELTT
jgi:hypothetical protein